MCRDRARLERLLRDARRAARAGRSGEALLARVRHEADRSRRLADLRRASIPPIRYPEELPVSQKRDEIRAALESSQVVVVCGETGSGKTTQLPKICLEMGRGVLGLIGHTQPRRIAARSVATRIASELGVSLGRQVGYKVRFTDRSTRGGLVKLMTDGVLLAETQSDRLLEQYDTIIIDEAHERSLNIDFLLGYLRQVLPRRADLKIIITSATIDPGRFSDYFGGAPIVEVSGRGYPVEVRYRPVVSPDPDEQDRTMEQGVVDAADELSLTGPGDMLVFLPGEREIRETAELLTRHRLPTGEHAEILPLYAKLSAEEQDKVFRPHPARRIILSTNVAETSLTVPGIRFVIDTGVARISRYSPRRKIQRLPLESISRASANQRAGRCGRIGPGICIRLYDEADFENRPPFTDPEVLRSNLASVILQMKALRLGDPERFGFLDAPSPNMIADGWETLAEINAVDDKRELTEVGRRLAHLPVDPRVGRMILAAASEGCLSEVLVIAAALSVQDPRERPHEKRDEADAAHEAFRAEGSDFLSFLSLWKWFHDSERTMSGSALRRACRERFLSFLRLREWADTHRQLRTMVTEQGDHPSDEEADPRAVHRALLAGLICNIGVLGEDGEYAGVRGNRFRIWPGSALARERPRWIVGAELVKTSRLYARTVARIREEWIEDIAAHLVKRTYSDPHWDARSARTLAFEKVSLLGLEIVSGRKVHYGPIDPRASRDLFIEHALVRGEMRTRAPFVRRNRELLEHVATLESKARRRGIVADESARFEFFSRVVPERIYTGELFERWRRRAERENPEILCMTPADLLPRGTDGVSESAFPDALPLRPRRKEQDEPRRHARDAHAERSASPPAEPAEPGTHSDDDLPLDYRFEPGAAADGVTLTVPAERLDEIDPASLEWLVPGLLHEKVVSLIRTLPKELRRGFVPIPDTAHAALQKMTPAQGPLIPALTAALHALTGVEVPASAWRADELPDYLRMRLRVVDRSGDEIAAGRDYNDVVRRARAVLRRILTTSPPPQWNRENVRSWDFGPLPEVLELDAGGVRLVAHPALVDLQTAAGLRLFDRPEPARAATRQGTRRLITIELLKELRSLVETAPEYDSLRLRYAPLGRANDLRDQLVDRIADLTFLEEQPPPRTAEALAQRIEDGWNRLGRCARRAIELTDRILAEHQQAAVVLADLDRPALKPCIEDARAHLARLVAGRWLADTPWPWLERYPVYLAAVRVRLRKLGWTRSGAAPGAGIERDRESMIAIAPYERVYREWSAVADAVQRLDPALELYRWMLEEYRVSVFAQELGTAVPVSPKRLAAQWALIKP